MGVVKVHPSSHQFFNNDNSQHHNPSPHPFTPSTRNPTPSPTALIPQFDLIDELANNRSLYIGDETIGRVILGSLPRYVNICLQRIQAAVPPTNAAQRPPSKSLVVSCSISHGLDFIESRPSIQNLLEIRSRFHKITGVSAAWIEAISAWFDTFPLSMYDPVMGGRTRVDTTLTTEDAHRLIELKTCIGSSKSMWAQIAVIATLSTQQDSHQSTQHTILPDHLTSLQQTIDTFDRVLETRYMMAKAFIDVVEKSKAADKLKVRVRPRKR